MERPLLVDELFRSWAPGVYRSDEFAMRPSEFATGVPVFIGMVPKTKQVLPGPQRLHFWPQFKLYFGGDTIDYQNCMVAYAVRGFFQNGGKQCYVLPLSDEALSDAALRNALETTATLDVDLVCVPDLGAMKSDKAKEKEKWEKEDSEKHELEQIVVKHCEDIGDRFAILDSHQEANKEEAWSQWSAIDGKNGAIYYPWLKVRKFSDEKGKPPAMLVPPCGHVAGVYARSDHERGIHKAPANELLEGVLDLESHLTSEDQDFLNPKRVNCIRSFPGRGIRVWGARTLSGQDEWTYVNVRRIFLTAVRWIHWHMGDVAFEPNDAQLWARIERELNLYFLGLYRQGALKGPTPQDAYFVRCNAKTNPREVRELGQVITEIGLAPARPYEFVVVRLIHGQTGVSISGPIRPEQN